MGEVRGEQSGNHYGVESKGIQLFLQLVIQNSNQSNHTNFTMKQIQEQSAHSDSLPLWPLLLSSFMFLISTSFPLIIPFMLLISTSFFFILPLTFLLHLFFFLLVAHPIDEPLSEDLVLYFLPHDHVFKVGPKLDDLFFVFGVDVDRHMVGLILVIGLKRNAVQVETLAGDQVRLISFHLKCLLESILTQVFRQDLHQHSNHLTDLMVDEALSHQREANKNWNTGTTSGHYFILGRYFGFYFLVTFHTLLVYNLHTHTHDESLTAWILIFVSFGEIMVAVSLEVMLAQPIKSLCNGDGLFPGGLCPILKEFILLEQTGRDDVIIDSTKCIMPHIEALPALIDPEYPDFPRQMRIEVVLHGLVVNRPFVLIGDVLIMELKGRRYPITQCMHLLISPASTGPIDPSKTVGICGKDEAVLNEHPVEDILDSVASVTLVLQPIERLPVVAEKYSHLALY